MMKRTPGFVLFGLLGLWPLLMAYDQVGRIFHEYAGLLVIALVIYHVYGQRTWFTQWCTGRYTRYRWLQVITTVGSIGCFIAIAVSAVMISAYALPSMAIGSWIAFYNELHLLSVHWGLVFVGLHVGLHLDALRRRLVWWPSLGEDPIFIGIDWLLWLIAAYGIVSFIQLDSISYLTGAMHFAWHDDMTSSVMTVSQYVSLGVLYIRLGRLLAISCRPSRQ